MTQRLLTLWLAGADLRADWRARAACVAEDPELFFPIGSGRHAEEQVTAAKQVCHRCPVVAQCRDFAVLNGCDGVWGGLDDAERRLLRRRVRPSVALLRRPEPNVCDVAHS
jgi:WhiB family transcriptional regulator, redox-sensing transcriptional regulator